MLPERDYYIYLSIKQVDFKYCMLRLLSIKSVYGCCSMMLYHKK